MEDITPVWDLDMTSLVGSVEESIEASKEIQELEKAIAKVFYILVSIVYWLD